MGTDQGFGAWLRQRRGELGVTQDEVAERLGFSAALLRKLESGERRPSGQIAALLAEYFRVPPDEREAFAAFARAAPDPSAAAGVARGDASPRSPWRGVYARQTNLPTPLTPLIGREREVAAARDLLLQPRTRLLTITGAAGIGKTRLALQVAAGLVEAFEDGVFFVDLAPIADPDLALPTVARSVGLTAASDRSTEGALIDYLRRRRALLVLDNFEQVLDAAAAITRLLEGSPWVKALVTSREALHVRGERRFAATPLGLPDQRQPANAGAVAKSPAVALFVERAQAAAPDFALTEENAADVAAMCSGLEGLPLAIELAAARARHFSMQEMRGALSSRLTLLTGGGRDLPARHRTLRAAITWSHDLLPESEQRLFRRLGVFANGFTLDALPALYEGGGEESGAITDTLVALVDKHLVEQDTRVGPAGETRFRLLEAVREYAVERLHAHGESAAIRSAHAAYYLALAGQAHAHFTGPQGPDWGAAQIRWIDRLEGELDNIRAALDWYQARAEAVAQAPTAGTGAQDDLERGLRLASALRRVWLARGHITEGLQRLRAFLALAPPPGPTEPRELRAAYAGALRVVGRLAPLQGAGAAVRPLLEESLRIAAELDDKPGVALTLLILGAVTLAEGDYPAARTYQQESLARYQALGNRWGAAAALEDLGAIALNEEQFGPARAILEESLALYRAVGERFGAASAVEALGRIAYHEGDYGAARERWEESLRLRQAVGNSSRICDSLILLGWVALREGRHGEAKALWSEGAQLAQELGSVVALYWALVGLAALAGAQRRPARAARLFGAAEALQAARQAQIPPIRQAERDAEIARARAGVEEAAWAAAWADGAGMTEDAALAYGLGAAYRNAVGAAPGREAPGTRSRVSRAR